ncbi:MAG: hypothetical protein GX833_09410 [Clostridium sp.]|jgi:hypothetical protein|nr:hypothetical protein [Clostridium sp.]
MTADLIKLLKRLFKLAGFVLLPLSGIAYLIKGAAAMLALFSGGLLAVAGVALMAFSANYVFVKNGSAFVTIGIHFLKVFVTALAAWLFVRHESLLGVFFGIGYLLMVLAMTIYTRDLN